MQAATLGAAQTWLSVAASFAWRVRTASSRNSVQLKRNRPQERALRNVIDLLSVPADLSHSSAPLSWGFVGKLCSIFAVLPCRLNYRVPVWVLPCYCDAWTTGDSKLRFYLPDLRVTELLEWSESCVLGHSSGWFFASFALCPCSLARWVLRDAPFLWCFLPAVVAKFSRHHVSLGSDSDVLVSRSMLQPQIPISTLLSASEETARNLLNRLHSLRLDEEEAFLISWSSETYICLCKCSSTVNHY